MSTAYSIYEAKAKFSEVMRKGRGGQRVVVTYHGQPVAEIGADAWHLACALFLDPDANELVFLTLDRRQRDVAKSIGFTDA